MKLMNIYFMSQVAYFQRMIHLLKNWQEWYCMSQGETQERKEFIKKYELSDDSDDEDF